MPNRPRSPVIELRRGGRAPGGSYLYEGDALITGWHSHEVHQIEYAVVGVVEVETTSAHYLLPPQQAAWIPAGAGASGRDESRRQDRGGDVRPRADPGGGDRARIIAVSPLIREMMIYALRWPIDRPDRTMSVSDAFFRTLAEPGVRSARSRGAAEPADVGQPDRGGRDGLHEGAPRLGDGIYDVGRAVSVSERTLRRSVSGHPRALVANISPACADAPGDGTAGRARDSRYRRRRRRSASRASAPSPGASPSSAARHRRHTAKGLAARGFERLNPLAAERAPRATRCSPRLATVGVGPVRRTPRGVAARYDLAG